MNIKEFELLPYNWNTDNWDEKIRTAELPQFIINDGDPKVILLRGQPLPECILTGVACSKSGLWVSTD